ncbi:hypothetical protein Tco_1563648 [Tanacetum coccineum]
MSNPHTPLLRELSHAANLNDIRDQLPVLFRREVVKDLQKMENYHSSDEVAESIKIMRSMQLDDMEKASRLLLMARELQTKNLPDGMQIHLFCHPLWPKKSMNLRARLLQQFFLP